MKHRLTAFEQRAETTPEEVRANHRKKAKTKKSPKHKKLVQQNAKVVTVPMEACASISLRPFSRAARRRDRIGAFFRWSSESCRRCQ
jgi:hypothetical protein